MGMCRALFCIDVLPEALMWAMLVQMVSLLHLADITEAGVEFQSPVDGAQLLLTPEHSMAIQNRLGTPLVCQAHRQYQHQSFANPNSEPKLKPKPSPKPS